MPTDEPNESKRTRPVRPDPEATGTEARLPFFRSSLDVARTRVGAALAAPAAALVLIPLLVMATGLVVSFVCRRAHDRSIEDLARARFRDRGLAIARQVEETLRSAEPLLDSLREYLTRGGLGDPHPVFVRRMNDLMRDRPAVAYLFFGWANGDMLGAYRERDGRVRGTWRERDRHRLRNWEVSDERMTPVREDDRFMFDSRARPWYVRAVQQGGRTWTSPYVFFDQGVAGIACAEPLYGPDGRLLGVMTVEFNLNTLSERLEKTMQDAAVQCLLFSARRQLLAFPGYRVAEGESRSGQGELPLIMDLQAPAVQALSQRLPAAVENPMGLDFAVSGQPFLGDIRPVDFGADEKWFVATWGSLAGLKEPAVGAWHRSLMVVALSLLAAVSAAFLFARHLIRNRRRVVQAEQRAAQAADEARQLGSYRLVRKLGEGGMGEVGLAEHRLLSRPVAVKLIKPEQLSKHDQANVQSRFRREARTLARLESPHTIAIYDFGIGRDGSLFYVMELLHGLDLDDLVGRFGPLPLGRAVSILSQAACSLAEAHSHGLIHRDVKPANIYLCRKAEQLDLVKVLDFGLVHEHDVRETRLTQAGALYGTPGYTSPEQARDSSAVDLRSDIYSLACVGYLLIAGRGVFPNASPMAMVMAHVNQPAPPLSELTDRPVPPGLAGLLLKCLEKDPDRRPQDLHAFLRELAAVPVPESERWTEERCREWWDRADIRRMEVETVRETEKDTTRWLVPQRS